MPLLNKICISSISVLQSSFELILPYLLIIVRFLFRHKRNEIFAKRFNAKHISNPVNQMHHLFMNENLTQKRKHLLWQAKQKVKELNHEYIWTNKGQIFVRKNQNKDKILVKMENDLNKFKSLKQQVTEKTLVP